MVARRREPVPPLPPSRSAVPTPACFRPALGSSVSPSPPVGTSRICHPEVEEALAPVLGPSYCEVEMLPLGPSHCVCSVPGKISTVTVQRWFSWASVRCFPLPGGQPVCLPGGDSPPGGGNSTLAEAV